LQQAKCFSAESTGDRFGCETGRQSEPAVEKAVSPKALPPSSIYQKQWSVTLPPSLDESLTARGMPKALLEYRNGWLGWSGAIPTRRKDMWTIYYNYYINTIRDVDRSVQHIVDVMNDMDLWRDTVVVFTADHGEMAGAHRGQKGKGPFCYEANAHVPLLIAHPASKRGASCSALTSHLDLLPTFVGLTGLPEADRPATVKAKQTEGNWLDHPYSWQLLVKSQLPRDSVHCTGQLFA
jgi:arylsulfatase A-like enzyme